MDYNIIPTDQLKKKIENNQDFLLINVLSEASFESMHIPGSINIDVNSDDFLKKVKEETGGNKDKEIIVYCSSSSCQSSPAAARKLVEAGYTNITAYEEGVAGWKEAGNKLEGDMFAK